MNDFSAKPPEDEPGTGQTVAEVTEPGTGQAVAEVTDEPGTGQAVAEVTDEPGTGQTVAEVTDEPGTGQTVAEVTDEPGTGETVAEVTEPGTGQAVAEVTDEPGTGQAVTQAADEAGTGQAVTQAADETRSLLPLALAGGALVLILVVLVVVAGGSSTPSASPTSVPTGATTTTRLPIPEEFTEYRDDETGFNIRYPSEWNRQFVPVRDIRLIAAAGDGEAMSVRVFPIAVEATIENLGNYAAFTEANVKTNPSAEILIQETTTVGEQQLLAYYYLYTYNDPDSGTEGLHAHYFIFQGFRLYIVVLQSIPPEDFGLVSHIYDEVMASFRADENEPPNTPPGLVVPTSTSAP